MVRLLPLLYANFLLLTSVDLHQIRRFTNSGLAEFYKERVLILVQDYTTILQQGQLSLFAQAVTKKQKQLLNPLHIAKTGKLLHLNSFIEFLKF